MPELSNEGRAKVNLTLRVNGRRADGYHDLESVVAFADCADLLTLTPGPDLDLKMSGPLAQACGERREPALNAGRPGQHQPNPAQDLA